MADDTVTATHCPMPADKRPTRTAQGWICPTCGQVMAVVDVLEGEHKGKQLVMCRKNLAPAPA